MHDTVSPSVLSFPEYSLLGVSTAGIGTCVTVPEWKISFDVAQGLPFAFNMRNYLITHLHQDHASGIPYIISQKAMNSHPAPNFFLPKGTSESLNQIMKLWEKLEDHKYKYNFIETEAGKYYELGKDLYFESFSTKHRVNCQGYTVLQRHKQLQEKLRHLSQDEIINLRRQNVEVNEYVYLPKISFTGDTQIEFLDLSPQVCKSETLIMEVTYYDDKKSVEAARKWGHIHFDEVLQRIPKIESKNIIWIHMSARYNKKIIRQMIDEKLPDDRHRIHLL